MVSDPVVSVVLPVWNGERFLSEAVSSILGQSFAALELILVDDGSTDRTRAIAHEFARGDARVVVIEREHGGIAESLNAGIHAARGRYIARMDDDDVSLPSRLATQIAYLDIHPECVAVGANLEVVDEDGETIGSVEYPHGHDSIVDALISGSSSSMAHPTVVMRREAVLAVGAYRADHFPSEDLDLWLRLSEIGELANIDEKLLRYRRHRGAVSVRERQRQFATTASIVEAARRKRGLRPLATMLVSDRRNHAATYHVQCARIALSSGNRGVAIRHARRSIASAPLWPQPYAALAACALPKRTFAFALRLYERLRMMRYRGLSASAKMAP